MLNISNSYVVNPLAVDQQDYMKWHVNGHPDLHHIPDQDQLIQSLSNQLPNLSPPYPFKIGCTGYVQMTQPVPENTFGKAVDHCGRNVFIVGQYILFQRYQQGNIYMCAKTWHPA